MGRRRRGRMIDGVIVLDKPQGLSSNHALQQVKRLFNAAKAGHTGSLDPLATGVLPLCLGEATKFAQFVLDAEKGYLSTFALGVETDTLDAEGEVTATEDATGIGVEAIDAAISTLTGPIEQVPPMYSALKRNGQPLYKLARQGVEVERQSRLVVVSEFARQAFRPGVIAEVDVLITCSKGTYIRSLAASLGEKLGIPAHVRKLRRIKAGPYALSSAVTVQDVEKAASEGVSCLDALLQPIDGPLMALAPVFLGSSAAFYLQQGQAVRVSNGPQSGMVRAYGDADTFLGIGEMLEDGRVAPRRLVVSRQR